MIWYQVFGLWLLGVVVGLSSGFILGNWYTKKCINKYALQIGNYIKGFIHSDIDLDKFYTKAVTILDRGKKAVDIAKEFIDILHGEKEK